MVISHRVYHLIVAKNMNFNTKNENCHLNNDTTSNRHGVGPEDEVLTSNIIHNKIDRHHLVPGPNTFESLYDSTTIV